MMYNSNGVWYLFGVASYLSSENDVCVNTNPSYFTSVPLYINNTNRKVSLPGIWATNSTDTRSGSSKIKLKLPFCATLISFIFIVCINQ